MSEAQSSETPEVPEVEQAVEKPKEVNTFLDFESDTWKQAPQEAREQAQARIALESREKGELKRKLEEQKRLIREKEEKLLELQRPTEVALPPSDLAYTDEEEHQRQTQAHIESVRRQAEWEKENEMRQSQLRAESEREHQERVGSFVKRGESVGIDSYQLGMAADYVGKHVSDDVANFILTHENGPQLVNQLATNPMEVQTLASLNTIEAGVKLNDMAKAYQRKVTTNAPPPDDPLKGSGATSEKRGPKGATFS